jgi:hypothetical protein
MDGLGREEDDVQKWKHVIARIQVGGFIHTKPQLEDIAGVV